MKWIFKPIAGANDGQGDSAVSSIFRGHAKDFALGELFARESISNSADQKNKANSEPAKIYIDIIDLLGDPKTDFLNALDWTNLSSHIKDSIASAQSTKKKILARGLSNINSAATPLSLVRISDFNTEGLSGPEDGSETSDPDDPDGNFYLFARATFMTNEAAGIRQGSYGLGKRVFYETSDIDTVLMSSTILNGDGSLDTRSFGRVELNTHKTAHSGTEDWNPIQKWEGPGFFGVDGSYNSQVRADSSKNENSDTLDKLLLNRAKICSDTGAISTGTSVISIAFDEWGAAENKLANFESEIKKWFWPALSQQDRELRIFLRIFDNHNIMTEKELRINDDSDVNWMPFVEAMQNDSNAVDLSNIGNITQNLISWDLPATVDASESYSHGDYGAEGLLKVTKSEAENSSKKNYLALLRNKLCVMNYIEIPNPVNDNCYLYGVFLAGHAANDMDDYTYNFLRQSEPPLHDNWLYAHKVANFYKFIGSNSEKKIKAATKLQKSIYSKIRLALTDLVAVEAPVDRNNLDDLSSFFNFGRRTSGSIKEIDSKIIDHSVSGRALEFTINITNLKPIRNSSWTAVITSKINGINGYGENNLLITSVVPSNSDSAEYLTISNQRSTWIVESKEDIESYDVIIEAQVPSFFSDDEIPELEPMFNIKTN